MRILQKALTFDDVLLVPAYSEVLPRDTQLATQLTRNLRINIPMVSAVMDTVTEARLAIAIAQEGGIGFIHKNMSADQQAAEVLKVKRHEAGVVAEPITIGPDMLVGDVIALAREKHISGLPVVDGKKVLVTGTIEGLYTFTHPFGCSQTGHDHAQTRKLLAALVRHPNAAAVLVLHLGCENLQHDQFVEELGEYDHDRVKFLTCQDVDDDNNYLWLSVRDNKNRGIYELMP